MSDREPPDRLTEDDFADLVNDRDLEREDAEALAGWLSREWGPE